MSAILTIEITPDELDIVTESLMCLASCYEGQDAEYTQEIVTLHNKLAMLVHVDASELN